VKVLLTQPLIEAERVAWPFKLRPGTNTFLLGQAMLAAAIREHGHEVHVLDPCFEQTTTEELVARLERERYDVVGVTIYTLMFGRARALLELVRTTLPGAFTVAGGPHPTSVPIATLDELPELDCVVCGEGEQTLVELLERLQSRQPLDDVAGIAFRPQDDGGGRLNPPRSLVRDLDQLPMAAYDLFPIRDYVPTPNIVRRYPTVTTQVTRGCPHRCAFCDFTLGRVYRHRSVPRIIDELTHLKERYGARGVVFRDSTLTVDPSFLRELCEAMITAEFDLAWMCYSRTPPIARDGDELLPLMKRAGCWQIGFGCESGNQASLDLLRKGTTVEENVEAVRKTIAAGIMCSTTWILALPGEDRAASWRSVELAASLGSHVAKFFLPIPYPGTELEKLCRAEGGLREDLRPDDFEFFLTRNPPYVNPRIGREGMVRLQQRAYLRFYATPRVWLRNVRQIRDADALRKYWHFVRLLV
jgi:anaerobic magnesium-protoporphyrin IX monomethyl ester cyclase